MNDAEKAILAGTGAAILAAAVLPSVALGLGALFLAHIIWKEKAIDHERNNNSDSQS